MRNFIYLFSKLFLLVLLLLFPVICFYNFKISKNIQNIRRSGYNNEEILILGSSHGRDGIHDKIIKNSYNLSSSGFSLEETYMELIRLEKYHVLPKTIIVSFSPFSLHKTNSKPKKTNIVFDVVKDYGYNPTLSFFRNSSRKEILFSPVSKKTQYFNNQLSEEEIDMKSKNDYYSQTSFSKVNYGFKFLFQISNYCKNNKIRLIFIVFPLPTNYTKLLQENETWREDLLFMNNNKIYFEFYDFSNFFESELLDSTHFVDGSHLNSIGGLLFTKYLRKNLFSD
ncbi:hypothetical protein N8340_02160 [Flavobacteriaceae bacterium]|nr:hypothetical protein [Flavobacteriaceae bacterium]